MNDNGIASTNITIQNCYFGKSEDCGEPIVAIGTHNQVSSAQKCNDTLWQRPTVLMPVYR